MADDIEEGNDGPSKVEQSGYEFEKGRQKLLDERAAVEEAYQQAFKEKVDAKGCSMMLKGLGIFTLALVWFIGTGIVFDDGLPDSWSGTVRLFAVFGGWMGLSLILALYGALKFLAGCACAEDFTEPVKEEDLDRAE